MIGALEASSEEDRQRKERRGGGYWTALSLKVPTQFTESLAHYLGGKLHSEVVGSRMQKLLCDELKMRNVSCLHQNGYQRGADYR